MEGKGKLYDHVQPRIESWPIYHLSEDRTTFIEEVLQFTVNRLKEQHGDSVSDLLAKTIYLEQIRIKEEPWKVDPPNEREFFKHLGKRLTHPNGLEQPRKEIEANNLAILQQIVRRYAEEIVGTFRIKTFLFARRFLTFFFSRLLNTAMGSFWGSKYRLRDKLLVRGCIEEVRSLIQRGTVIIVPTHFSNLDSILIGYAIDTFAGIPAFSYGAGLNLYNTGYTAYFMNRLGAYRVDRRKKNGIYLETLKAMSNLSIQRGVHNLFFPGGTRSRSGALETKLKMGLLGTVVEAQRALLKKGKPDKIFVVPVVLSYPVVLEAQYLIEQHLKKMGRERYLKTKDSFQSLRSILKFSWGIFSKSNKITISFGQPMDVIGNQVDAEGQSYDRHGRRIDVEEYFYGKRGVSRDLQREMEYTKLLAEKIVERFHRDNIVLSSHLVSFAAFGQLIDQNAHLDLYGILRLPTDDYVFERADLSRRIELLREELFEMERTQRIRLSSTIRYDLDALLDHGIATMGNYHLSKPLKIDRKGQIVSDSFVLLYYYHNRLSTYHLEKVFKEKARVKRGIPAEAR